MRPSGSDIPRARSFAPVDLGWLFLLPGMVLIAAAVLIAAEDDLYEAKFRRDEALAIEARHAERVERYAAYLDAVQRRDPTVIRSLVVGQLNSEFTDLVEARLPGVPVYDSTEVFASLEPPEAAVAHRERVDSVLARWATDNSSRVWLLASGALCVFVGLLPPVNRRAAAPLLEHDDQEDMATTDQDADQIEDDAEADAEDATPANSKTQSVQTEDDLAEQLDQTEDEAGTAEEDDVEEDDDPEAAAALDEQRSDEDAEDQDEADEDDADDEPIAADDDVHDETDQDAQEEEAQEPDSLWKRR